MTPALKAQILSELDALIAQGKKLEGTFKMTSMGSYVSSASEAELRAFVTAAFAALKRLSGESSEYYRHIPQDELKQQIGVPGYIPRIIPATVGALSALRSAVDAGLLVSLEDRMRANIHDDFLEQGNSLLGAGYHVAAMVLIGGVLENHLRKLCDNRALKWTGDGSISKYNDLLHGSLYDKPTWRRIQSIGDLRNDAAHGNGAAVKVADATDAHKYVGRLLADHPA